MSCCGKSRMQAGRNYSSAEGAPAAAKTVLFEYVGRTALTIIGPVTRTSYRFDSPGARVTIDPRDRNSLYLVPVLKEVNAALHRV